MTRDELELLIKKYKAKYLTIHENSFKVMNKWHGFYRKLYLEMNYDNSVASDVKVKKIGGFCVDLSHFKSAEEKWSKEFKYTLKRRQKRKTFASNHLNGYSYKENHDLHTITSLKQFDYLKTLPEFVFGKVIAIEVFNSIEEQLKFKKHVIKLLSG